MINYDLSRVISTMVLRNRQECLFYKFIIKFSRTDIPVCYFTIDMIKENNYMIEGVIKFQCELIDSYPQKINEIRELIDYRNELRKLNLIGVYENGIGFGNISIRGSDCKFIITGSQTGQQETLTNEEFTKVIDYYIFENTLVCMGKIAASSESMTHAAIYEASSEVNAVIHTHNSEMWKRLINKVPTTSPGAEYGTPEIANEVKRLFIETDLMEKKIFVMAGHEDGVISFGKDLKEAWDILTIT